jgi:hypothetical protein
MTNGIYETRDADLLTSVMHIESPQRGKSRIIDNRRMLDANLYGSSLSINMICNVRLL